MRYFVGWNNWKADVLVEVTSRVVAFDVFSSARWLRNEAGAMVERTRRPVGLADLYIVIGQSAVLMGRQRSTPAWPDTRR
ncbi:hypothetical protein [Micromonospora wenchangensis]|uniref:hypothetical protein n=1 Tax=Micromonospora wenchangensis TaxID=1185415 RepID=UPI003D7144C9